MSYLTPNDLLRFGARELAEAAGPDDGDRSAYDADAQAAADRTVETLYQVIARAVDTLEGYCRARYSLPLSPVGEMEKGLLADIARYYLYEDRAIDEVKDRYEAAMGQLRAIAAGKLVLQSAASASGAGAGMPAFVAGGRTFGADEY